MRKLVLFFLLIHFALASAAQQKRIFAWGYSKEACDFWGARLDENSGLSEWKPVLKIDKRSKNTVSGTIYSGRKQLSFRLKGNSEGASYQLEEFLLQSPDSFFSFSVTFLKKNRYMLRELNNEREYQLLIDQVFFENRGKSSAYEVKNLDDSILTFDNPYYALVPFLSYKLGEYGITGKKMPLSLAIHRFAYSLCEKSDIVLKSLGSEKKLVPLGVNNSTGNNCSGSSPASSCEECWGLCGPKCTCWNWACGDCCCHKGCLAHDARCSCFGTIWCVISAVVVPFDCSSCNVPSGDLPCSTPGCPTGPCPPGQTWCSHQQTCIASGAVCEPSCMPGKEYCSRLRQCVTKGRCKTISQCSTYENCGEGSVCFRGECFLY